MTVHRWLAPLALLLAAAAPVPRPPAPPVVTSFQQELSEAAQAVDRGDAAAALDRLDRLALGTELPLERGQIDGLRSFALARLGRLAEAHKAIEASVAANPDPSLLLLRQLFLLRAFDGDPPGAADTLQLIAASFPKRLGEVPTEVIGDVMSAIAKDNVRAFNLDYALVAANWEPGDAQIGDVDGLRQRLITGLVERGRADEVPGLLAQVQDPAVLLRLGIDRRYSQFWPEIERLLGPGATKASGRFVDAAKARFDANPKSLVARLGYAQALNIAAREPEAIVVADAAKTPAELAALKKREIWLVDLHARLLGDAGRVDEALARLAALNATPMEGRPELANTIINEALLAETLGRPREALKVADFADSKPHLASEYGRAYLTNARACSLVDLGRKAEAEALAKALSAASAGNYDAVLRTQICLGEADAAARTIIATLADADNRTGMIFQLQPFLIADRPGLSANRLRENAMLRGLKARPDVKAAYLKAGRDLPAAVAPPR